MEPAMESAFEEASKNVGTEGEAQVSQDVDQAGFGPDLVNQGIGLSQQYAAAQPGAQPTHAVHLGGHKNDSITLEELQRSRDLTQKEPGLETPPDAQNARMDRLEGLLEQMIQTMGPKQPPVPVGVVTSSPNKPANEPARPFGVETSADETPTVETPLEAYDPPPFEEPTAELYTDIPGTPVPPVTPTVESLTDTPGLPVPTGKTLSEQVAPLKEDQAALGLEAYKRSIRGILSKRPQAQLFFRSLKPTIHKVIDPINWSPEFSRRFGKSFSKSMTDEKIFDKVCRDLLMMGPGNQMGPEAGAKYYRMICGWVSLYYA